MGWITMSCREQPSEAFSQPCPVSGGRWEGSSLPVNQTFTPCTSKLFLSCWSLSQQLRDHTVKKGWQFDSRSKTGVWHIQVFFPMKLFLNQLRWCKAGQLQEQSPSSHLFYFAAHRKEKMDAAGKLCSFVVLKVLSWLFHHISSFSVFANEFNDPKK